MTEPKLPAVDAEFAKALGVEDGDVARMRAEIRQNVERETKKRIQAKIKDQVMAGLAAAATFEVPRSLLDMEIEPHAPGRHGGPEAARHDHRQHPASRRTSSPTARATA